MDGEEHAECNIVVLQLGRVILGCRPCGNFMNIRFISPDRLPYNLQ